MEIWKEILSSSEKKSILKKFGTFLSKGQMKLIRAAHLDFLESGRTGTGFIDAESGRKIIDCFTSAGCFNVGRGNPEIIQSLLEAAETLDMGSNILTSKYKIAFAKKLASISPGDLNHVIHAAGGADAIDCAIKLARAATGRNKVISMVKAYHGHTGFSLSANGKEYYRQYFEPLMPGFDFVNFGDLEAVRAAADNETAAIILEPVQGEGGIFAADDFYLHEIRKLCNKYGIMLIFDEIQTGFCRTGKMFASEHSGVVPDLMTLAKSISGGLFPVAAVVYRDIPVLTSFVDEHPDFHPSVAGGSDPGCVAGIAVIDYILKTRLWENAEKSGNLLKAGLQQLKDENPNLIMEVRGRGLMLGIQYTHEYMGALMADSLAKHGIFAVYSGNQPQVMRFMMPLTATPEDIRESLRIIESGLATMKKFLPLTAPISKIPLLRGVLNNIKVQITLFDWIRFFEDLLGITKRNYGRGAHS